MRNTRNLLAITDQEFMRRSTAHLLAAFESGDDVMLVFWARHCWSFALTMSE